MHRTRTARDAVARPDRARERVSGVPVGAFRCFQGDAALKHIGYKGSELGRDLNGRWEVISEIWNVSD